MCLIASESQDYEQGFHTTMAVSYLYKKMWKTSKVVGVIAVSNELRPNV